MSFALPLSSLSRMAVHSLQDAICAVQNEILSLQSHSHAHKDEINRLRRLADSYDDQLQLLEEDTQTRTENILTMQENVQRLREDMQRQREEWAMRRKSKKPVQH